MSRRAVWWNVILHGRVVCTLQGRKEANYEASVLRRKHGASAVRLERDANLTGC